MSDSLIPNEIHPNDCGCCEGLGPETPLEIYNRPGLKAIAYRVGTHARFKRTMLAHLSSSSLGALGGLRTRESDDFTIALLDAWAVASDLLTFYQERIANESYLRTATERISLLELARLIGYELRPGVAADAYLAFTLEETPAIAMPAIPDVTLPVVQSTPIQQAAGVPGQTIIGAGLKVQSVPGPGEKPQIFETIAPVNARVEWNAIRPRLARPHPPVSWSNSFYVKGQTTSLKAGDRILVVPTAHPENRTEGRIKSVVGEPAANRTRLFIEFGSDLEFNLPSAPPPGDPSLLPSGPTSLSDSFVSGTILMSSWKQDDLVAFAARQSWSLEELETSINEQLALNAQAQGLDLFALRVRAALFGHNAPQYEALPASLRLGEWVENRKADGSLDKTPVKFVQPSYPKSWQGRTLKDENTEEKTTAQVYLDNTYPAIVKGNWIILECLASQSNPVAPSFIVEEYVERSRSKYTISAKVSYLKLDKETLFEVLTLRGTTAYAQSERLELAEVPIADAVEGDDITLDRAYLGMSAGQRIALTGERTDIKGIFASEVREISEVTLDGGYTKLSLKKGLDFKYVRETVRINGNVALATHGETRQEILGSGDARIAFQRFTLRQPPLTYIQAPTASGSQSTLEVRVGDVAWQEVSSFYGRGKDERIYITRTDDDGKTIVQFGDGQTGARLPTGQDNVMATYRRGSGVAGLVKARQLSLLMQRPPGVKEVLNPLEATGADDPEQRDQARGNAPLTVLTMDRIVSLRDYQDFARSFSGIAKSLATWTWDGQRRGVFVTVAGPGGTLIKDDSTLLENLVKAMRGGGDPSIPLSVKSYVPAFFKLAASLKVRDGYRPELVLKKVQDALLAEFSFDARSFGEPVTLSELIALMQNVEGVLAVNITSLYPSGTVPAATPPTHLAGALPQEGGEGSVMQGAALLLLDPTTLSDIGVTNP